MSRAITLTLRAVPGQRVVADAISPDRLAGLTTSEIAALPMRLGRAQLLDSGGRTSAGVGRRTRGPPVGDLFAIETGDSKPRRIAHVAAGDRRSLAVRRAGCRRWPLER